MKRTAILLTLTLLALTGCTMSIATQSAATEFVEVTHESTSVEISDSLPEATETFTPQIIPEETVEPLPQTYEPFTTYVWADHVNVRTNPGYLFPSLLQLNQGDEITVLAKAPGNEWLFVQLPDETTGWVFTLLVQLEDELSIIPVQKPADIQIITGQLLTQDGVAINGVQFSIIQTSPSGELRNDANTDETGIFIAYMPLDSTGDWTVTYTAISCTSIVHDASCNTLPQYAGSVDPASQIVTLPDADMLEFIWK